MSTTAKPRTADEIGDVAEDLLKRVIEPTLPPTDAGRFVCVDIDSGAYEVDDDDMVAVHRLLARVPGAESYLGRVGEPAADRMGLRLTPLGELAQAGDRAYHDLVRPRLVPADDGKYVAIDVGTGDYEVDEDDHAAITRLQARRPGADIWLEMAGEATAYKLSVVR